MSERELPEGWQDVSLEELAAPTPGSIKIGPFGSSLKKADLLSEGPYKVYGQENILSGNFTTGNRFIDSAKWNELRSCELSAGDVCITMMGSLGGGRIVPDNIRPGVMDSHLLRIRPNLKVVAPDFLVVFLRGSPLMNRQLDEYAHGSIMAGLNASIVRSLRLPLPPLSEQRRIVAKVEQLLARANAARDRLDKVLRIMRRFRQSVLSAACSGRLTEDWRGEHPDVEPARGVLDRARLQRAGTDKRSNTGTDADGTEEADGLPETWAWASIGELARVQGGIQKQPKRAPKKNAFPYLRVANVLRGRLDLTEIHRMELFEGELETYRLEPNDLLIVEGNGSLGEIGRCALWDGSIPNCVHQNHIIRVRVDHGIPQYLLYFWNSPVGVQRMANVSVTTAGLYNLSTGKVKAFPVPVAPVQEQREIVRRVEALLRLGDAIERRVASAKTRGDKLTQSVLAKAFRGELVPTEAELARQEGRSYEPASALLARITAEREKEVPQSHKNGTGKRTRLRGR